MNLTNVMFALPNIVFWKDKNLAYIGCNEKAAKILGLKSSADIKGKFDDELPWVKHFSDQTQQYDREIIASGIPKEDIGEVLVLTSGKLIDVVTDRMPFFDDDGKLAGILVIYTESKKRNLTDQTFFQHILKSLPYYIFWKNKDSMYLGANDNFTKLVTRQTPKDLIGLTDYDLNWGQGEANLFRSRDKKVMQGSKQVNVEEILVRPDGSEITMLVSKVPVRNNSNDTIGMLGISVDITNIKKTELELKEAKERAELANQAKSDFIANMSHDLRTPLNAILGATDIFHIKRYYPEQEEFIEIIKQASKNLLHLIEDVLNFAKLETGKLELQSSPLDLRQLVEEAVSMISHQANQKGLKLIVSYADDVPRYVISDSNALRRIIINLLSNAIKFTQHGHIIVAMELINISSDKTTLRLIIEDTGIGIPKDKINYIFDRFTRIEPSYSSKQEGIGLGLNIVKQLVYNLGGAIDVDSQPGNGSTFFITLPFKLQDIAKIKTNIQYSFSKFRILIVDDYLSRGKIIKKQLDTADCQITTGKNALTELEQAYHYNKPLHIVMIDDEIVDVDPCLLAKNIYAKVEFSKILLILITKPIPLSKADNAKQAGFFKLLIKPIQPTEMILGLADVWNAWHNKQPSTQPQFKYTVLLVEDDRLSQKVCGTILNELGCRVDIADSGEKAIELVANKAYDLIFMDIGLHDMTGLSATEKIKNHTGSNQTIPIIALTAHASREDRELCQKIGMSGYLTKPASYEDIKKLLNSISINPRNFSENKI